MSTTSESKPFLKQIDKSMMSAYYPLHKNAISVDIWDVVVKHDNGNEETYNMRISHVVDYDNLYTPQMNTVVVNGKSFTIITRVVDSVKEVEINPLFTEEEDMTIYDKIIHVIIVTSSLDFNSTYLFVEVGQEYSEFN